MCNQEETGNSFVQVSPKIICAKGIKQLSSLWKFIRIRFLIFCKCPWWSCSSSVDISKDAFQDRHIEWWFCIFNWSCKPNSLIKLEVCLLTIWSILKHAKCLATRIPFAWFWINISPICQSQPSLWQKNDISLITLPPHTSHKLRPLNCNFCGPYGTYDNIRLNDWILSNPGKLQQSTVFQLLFKIISSRHLSDLKLGNSILHDGLWGILGCHRCTEFTHCPNWHVPVGLLHWK